MKLVNEQVYDHRLALDNITIGTKVADKWYPEWGIGIVNDKSDTGITVDFSNKGIVRFDRQHLQFLKRA